MDLKKVMTTTMVQEFFAENVEFTVNDYDGNGTIRIIYAGEQHLIFRPTIPSLINKIKSIGYCACDNYYKNTKD